MSASVFVDRSKWPIVILRYTSEPFSDADFAKHLDETIQLLRNRGPVVLISDINHAPPPPASQRKMMVSMLRDNAAVLQRDCRGWAQVTSSALTRGIITAVQWLQPAPIPTKVFATLEEAEAWARSKLGQA